jgi:hypothetical protein
MVAALYGVTIDEVIKMIKSGKIPDDELFTLDANPQLKQKADKAFKSFATELTAIIAASTAAEWNIAGINADAAIDVIAKKTGIRAEKIAGYGARNLEALAAFQNRKERGMNLSTRVWKYTEQFRKEIELALDIGIGEGRSAAQLSRDVRRYLNEPDKLFRRVRDKHGNLVLSKAAQAYHPGQGVYRSSYRNARCLTATETNMAYREADYLKWQPVDFVTGFEVKLSGNHPIADICDDLKGKYPKGFKFIGWHPLCRCYVVPILMTLDEMEARSRAIMADEDVSTMTSVNDVKDVPDNFKKWVKDNADRIERANAKGTLPYFLKDNATFAGLKVKNINLTDKTEFLKAALAKYNAYDANVWTKACFDEKTGGYVVVDKQRIEHSKASKNEKAKLDKEQAMAMVFAKNGYKIEMLKEIPGVSSPDVRFNGMLADLKSLAGHNNIVKRAKKAVKEQGAEVVLFEFGKMTHDIQSELIKLKNLGISTKYFVTGINVVIDL